MSSRKGSGSASYHHCPHRNPAGVDQPRTIASSSTPSSGSAGRVYNVGEADAPTEAEWVEGIGRAAGWAGRILGLPKDALPPYLATEYEGTNFGQHWVVDRGRIRRELGYEESVSRHKALRRTVAWERENPPEEVDPAEFDYAAEDGALERLG